MRYLVLADIHGNWDALDAVLSRVEVEDFDATLILGDLVGLGASPNQVVDAVRNMEGAVHVVRGNHDKVAAGLNDGSHFNKPDLVSLRWTTEQLTPANLRYLRELPEGPMAITDEIEICHGSPLDEDTYVFTIYDAYEIFTNYDARVIFYGHIHIPCFFAPETNGIKVKEVKGDSFTLELGDNERYLINPGSVGQPRDRDPRAPFITYDSDTRTVCWHRVEYAIEKAQERILSAGLPKVLADRLALGI